MKLYFSDYFQVREEDLESYGAFNVSLVTDLPLFIDPFLLFNSKKEKYQQLHGEIIKYLIFLKSKSIAKQSPGALKSWYVFKEVKQNWFGFSIGGNKGSALGMDFATALNDNLHKIFQNFGKEGKITKSSHLEKLCLIKGGVGKDNISDFATNLIKEFLLQYTEAFAKNYIDKKLRDKFRVSRVRFNYETQTWEEGIYELPKFNGDYVLLTPKDLLTKDDTWINKADLIEDFERIPDAISDEQLRFQVNNYFLSRIPNDPEKDKEPTEKERGEAIFETLRQFPELIDYYIKLKEIEGDTAESISKEKVAFSENIFVKNVKKIVAGLERKGFYQITENSLEEAKKKIQILKDFIEKNDGYKLFYNKGKCIGGEKEAQLLFALVCKGSTEYDVNREVNNGRGPVDFKFSKGSFDGSLVEFKLAKNKKLKQNLENQVEIYQEANPNTKAIKVIIYFSEEERLRVMKILKELNLIGNDNIILIDARKDNKLSASNVK